MIDVILSIYPNIPTVVELIAAGVFVVIGVYSSMQKTFITYILTNPKTKQKYIGRTSGTGSVEKIVKRRLYNHKYFKQEFTEIKLDKVIQAGIFGRYAIRGREQNLLDYHGGLKNPTIANKIRAVALINPMASVYLKYSNEYFDQLKY